MKENLTSQRDLWDAQHKARREEHEGVAGVPNASGQRVDRDSRYVNFIAQKNGTGEK